MHKRDNTDLEFPDLVPVFLPFLGEIGDVHPLFFQFVGVHFFGLPQIPQDPAELGMNESVRKRAKSKEQENKNKKKRPLEA